MKLPGRKGAVDASMCWQPSGEHSKWNSDNTICPSKADDNDATAASAGVHGNRRVFSDYYTSSRENDGDVDAPPTKQYIMKGDFNDVGGVKGETDDYAKKKKK